MRHVKSLALALLLVLTGCSERPSAVVQRAEAAGACDLTTVSVAAMQSWLENHRALAGELDGMCSAARQKASAQWTDTSEGRLCTAARNVVASTVAPLYGDHKTYESGWK